MRKFFTFAVLFTVAVAAFAQGAPAASTGSFNSLFDTTRLVYIAVAGAAAACGTAQAKVLSSAYEAMARNPQAADKISGSLVLGLAFIEALVLFTFALAFIVK
ncbi:MAG: ATP synthase F0 subunit C [Acidobacteria bacterium]|nr:ATP synthase F0 subunit C [Acidobacteriota bacterium]